MERLTYFIAKLLILSVDHLLFIKDQSPILLYISRILFLKLGRGCCISDLPSFYSATKHVFLLTGRWMEDFLKHQMSALVPLDLRNLLMQIKSLEGKETKRGRETSPVVH